MSFVTANLLAALPALSFAAPFNYPRDSNDLTGGDHDNQCCRDSLEQAERTRSNATTSSRSSRLSRRFSRSTTASSDSRRSITKARKFLGDLFRTKPSEKAWKRAEQESASSSAAGVMTPVPFLVRMADGYVPDIGGSRGVTRFHDETDDDDDELLPLCRCSGSEDRRLNRINRDAYLSESWVWW